MDTLDEVVDGVRLRSSQSDRPSPFFAYGRLNARVLSARGEGGGRAWWWQRCCSSVVKTSRLLSVFVACEPATNGRDEGTV